MKCIEFSPIKISYWRRFSLLLSQCCLSALVTFVEHSRLYRVADPGLVFQALGKISTLLENFRQEKANTKSNRCDDLPNRFTLEPPLKFRLCRSLWRQSGRPSCAHWHTMNDANDGRMLTQRGGYESRWISMNCNLQSHEIRIKHSLRWMLLSNKRFRKGARRVPVG